jgi:acyl-CoA dehydrogenase
MWRGARASAVKFADHEGVQWLLGEAAMAIETGRLLVMKAAWKLDQGDFARQGGLHGQDPGRRHPAQGRRHGPAALRRPRLLRRTRRWSGCIATPARPARRRRLEVHKMVLARAYMAEGTDFWDWK